MRASLVFQSNLRKLENWEESRMTHPGVEKYLKLLTCIQACIHPHFPLSWKKRNIWGNVYQKDANSIVTLEPLDNCHAGLTLLPKCCSVIYMTSWSAQASCATKLFCALKTDILCVYNALLASIEKFFKEAGLHLDILKLEASSQLHGLYINDVLHGTLEGKYYQCIYMVFPFIYGYVDRVKRYEIKQTLNEISSLLSGLVGALCSDRKWSGINNEQTIQLINKLREIQTRTESLNK